MRIPTTILVALALILVAITTATAVGKLTVDPNLPGARPLEENILEDDSVFDRKITYDGPDVDLTLMLSEVSTVSGVKMQPSARPENWQVRQRTAVVFVNDAPLMEFRSGLARLFGYRWTRVTADDGKRSYVLREIEVQKETHQGKIDAENQAQVDANRASIHAAVEAAARSTTLSPQEIRSARESDPWLYYLATNPSGRKWAEVIQSIPADWWEQAAQGIERRVDVAKATDPAELKIISLLDQIRELPPSGTSMYGSNSNSYLTYRSDPLDQFILSAGTIAFFIRHTARTNGGKDLSWTPEQIEFCPIASSTSSPCMTAGYKSIMSEDGTPLEQVGQAALGKTCDYFSAGAQAPQPKSTIDGRLLREIELKPIADPEAKDEPQIVALLRGLAKASGFTVMLETFDDNRDISPKSAWAPEKGTVFDILSDITKTGRMTWERSGNLILLRYREWPKLRALEVSRDLVKRWEDRAKAHDCLAFDDLYDIVSNATHDQITKTLVKNKLLNLAGLGSLIRGPYYAPLKAAAMLPDNQSRLFRSEAGVPAKLFRQIDLASDPAAKPLQSFIDAAKCEVAVIGTHEVTPSGQPRRVHLFIRCPDGKTDKWDWPLATRDGIKAFQAYVKSLEKTDDPR